MTRIAWFSPLPPARSGIAAYSAELLSRLDRSFAIDRYPESNAHDFVWKARHHAYDLVVYQMGNSRAHDYMWAYLAHYPGLVVLHDARLHHARARQLLEQERFDDYRAELSYDEPEIRPDFADYAIDGLGGAILYFWPMLRAIVRLSRVIVVHNAWVAGELRELHPHAIVDVIRMGVPELPAEPDARTTIRQSLGIPPTGILLLALGKVTAEKRIGSIVRALGALADEGHDAYLTLIGDASEYAAAAGEIERSGVADRVRLRGHIEEAAIANYLAAADVCLCLRWPTALETSASWLRCLAARRATVISDLAHLADIPSDVAMRVDLLDEDQSLLNAMRRLAVDEQLRAAVADAGHAHWARHHTLDMMAADYRRVLTAATAQPAPVPTADLPRHFTADYSEPARAVAKRFGVSVDIIG